MSPFKQSKSPKTKSEIDYLTIGYYIRNSKEPPIPNWAKPFWKAEKRLEALLTWLKSLALLEILGIVGNIGIIVAVVTFISNQDVRHDQDVFSAWQTITSSDGQSGNGGRKEAIEFLVSRPWRFPWPFCNQGSGSWLGCVFRHKRQNLDGLDLSVENGPGAYLSDLRAPNSSLRAANLSDADLTRANLQNAWLNLAILQDTSLVGANLKKAHLIGANLQDAYLTYANLQEARLDNANLQDAYIERAYLKDAILSSVNLQDAFLENAYLRDAWVGNSNLQNARLGWANLQDTYLGNTNFKNADLRGTNLSGADLTGANLEDIFYNAETQWPEGFNPPPSRDGYQAE